MTANRPGVTLDEILPPDGGGIQMRRLVTDALLVLPNIIKLVARLLRDPRVPRRSKVALGLAAAYVVTPRPDEDAATGFVAGDVVAYRCEDCLDRWDVELTDGDA